MDTVHWTVSSVHCLMDTVHCLMGTVHCPCCDYCPPSHPCTAVNQYWSAALPAEKQKITLDQERHTSMPKKNILCWYVTWFLWLCLSEQAKLLCFLAPSSRPNLSPLLASSLSSGYQYLCFFHRFAIFIVIWWCVQYLNICFPYSIKHKFKDSEHDQCFNVQKLELKAILLFKGPHQK